MKDVDGNHNVSLTAVSISRRNDLINFVAVVEFTFIFKAN